MVYLGVDIGGTTIKGIVMKKSLDYSSIISRKTYAMKGGRIVLKNVFSIIKELLTSTDEKVMGIGIGLPGLVDLSGKIIGDAVNIRTIAEVDLKNSVEKKFKLPVTLANDVNMATFGEYKVGAGKKFNNIVCIALGTGVGGGIVIEDKLFTGTKGMAAEIGHIVVEPFGRVCSCKLKGCVETYASATGIVKTALKHAFKFETPLAKIAKSNPSKINTKLIYQYCFKGDRFALFVNEKTCEMLARLIGILFTVFTPELFILGGGVSNASEIIIPKVQNHLNKYIYPEMLIYGVKIVQAQLGDRAGVVGAALYAKESLSKLKTTFILTEK